jgi:hypothetical protein
MIGLNRFIATMDAYGGPAKNNLFVVRISPQNDFSRKSQYILKEDLTFFCSDITLPAINLSVAPYKANTFDIAQNIPLALDTPSINARFMLDSQHRVVSFFHSWMQEIINYDPMGGPLSAINNDHALYEIGYKNDYACTIRIEHYKTNAKITKDSPAEKDVDYYEYAFYNAFPTEIAGENFSWTPNDEIATLGVNFTASSFSFSGSEAGTPTSRLNSGTGYLDFLNSVGFRGQTVQQRNLPTSIQDAINTFTTVRNDFGSIKNTFRTLQNIF